MSTVLIENASVISVADAASMLGVTTGRVNQLIHDGRIKARKLTERAWAVDLSSVQKYARSDRKPGPKAAS